MTKLKYLCITLILAMVVAFAGSASVEAPSFQKGKWLTDDVLNHHASEPVAASTT